MLILLHRHFFVLLLSMVLAGSSCSPSPACDALACSGCCDSTGTCRSDGCGDEADGGDRCADGGCVRSDGGPAAGGTAGGSVGGGASGGHSAGGAGGGTPDAGALVDVGHQRELRGVWVATVSNLDVAQGLGADAGVESMRALVERVRSWGLNSIFYQIRPESDAWYTSSLEPWSRFMTGTQGQVPGWDPLDALLTAAHERGVEVHAWVNPYRALSNAASPTVPQHISQTLPQHAIRYDGRLTMDPGAPAVRRHVVQVIRDVLSRYDVDGIHFDDYFYPYPDAAGTPFPDDSSYQLYRNDGGILAKGDWRRENVNTLIREVMAEIRANQPHVRFGVSPFGIWRPNFPAGVTGFDAYDILACDALAWISNGTVDYVAPQLYWLTSSTGQPFSALAAWWGRQTTSGALWLDGGTTSSPQAHIFTGHALYKLGTPNWDVAEVRAQISATRALRSSNVAGGIFFRESMLRTNVFGVADVLKNELYSSLALPPVILRAGASNKPQPPVVERQGASLRARHSFPLSARAFALYRWEAGNWALKDVAGGSAARFGPLSQGTWAVSAINRGGAESRGFVVQIP